MQRTFSVIQREFGKRTAFALFLTAYLAISAHMLRNLSAIYLVVLGAIEIACVLYILWYGVTLLGATLAQWHVAFVIVSSGAMAQTIYDYGVGVGAYASVRYFMVLPMVPLAAVALNSSKRVERLIKTFIVIICIGVVSVAVQYAIGPISWFAEPGERGGLMRFGSILGSLPTIGGAVPLALFGALVIRMRLLVKILIILTLVIGVLISLSKNAVGGTILALILFLFAPTPSRKRNVTVLVVVLIAGLLVLPFAASNAVLDRTGLYIAALFIQDSADRGGDVTMQASMQERWTALPAQSLGWLLEARGALGFLTGGGFQMVGSALMPDGATRYFTSHDTYVDLILIAGLPLLIVYIGIMCGMISSLSGDAGRGFFREDPEIRTAAVGLTLILVISGLFCAGETYQPIIAALWCALSGVAIQIQSTAQLGKSRGTLYSPASATFS